MLNGNVSEARSEQAGKRGKNTHGNPRTSWGGDAAQKRAGWGSGANKKGIRKGKKYDGRAANGREERAEGKRNAGTTTRRTAKGQRLEASGTDRGAGREDEEAKGEWARTKRGENDGRMGGGRGDAMSTGEGGTGQGGSGEGIGGAGGGGEGNQTERCKGVGEEEGDADRGRANVLAPHRTGCARYPHA